MDIWSHYKVAGRWEMGDGHVDCGELPRGLVLDSWTGEGGRGERRQRKEDPGAGRGDHKK